MDTESKKGFFWGPGQGLGFERQRYTPYESLSLPGGVAEEPSLRLRV